MREGLQPEVRVNKNGVPVIKHVRDGASPTSKKSMLAVIAPSLNRKLTEKAERRALVNHVGDALDYWEKWVNNSQHSFYGGPDSDLKKAYCESLSRYSLQNLRYVASACDTNASWDDQDKVMRIITNRHGSEGWVVTGIRYRSLLGDSKDNVAFFKNLSEVESYFTDEEYLSHADEGTDEFDFNVKVVSFALKVHEYTMKSGGEINLDARHPDYFTPISRELVKVMRDYPDKEDEILGFMRDRHLVPCMVSEETLREYLDTPSAPLRSGAL